MSSSVREGRGGMDTTPLFTYLRTVVSLGQTLRYATQGEKRSVASGLEKPLLAG